MGVVRPKKQQVLKPPSHHHSFWGGLGHHLLHNPVTMEGSRFGKDVANIAYKAPGGTYALGKAAVQTFDPRYIANPHHNPLGNLLLAGIESSARSLTPRQIVKHPGYAAVTALGIADPALRAASLPGKLARESKAASAIARARKAEAAKLQKLDTAAFMHIHGKTSVEQAAGMLGVKASELHAHMRTPATRAYLKHGPMSQASAQSVGDLTDLPTHVLNNPGKYPRNLVRAYMSRYPDIAEKAGLFKSKRVKPPATRKQTIISKTAAEERDLARAEGRPLSNEQAAKRVGTKHVAELPVPRPPVSAAAARTLGSLQNKAAKSERASLRRFGMRPIIKQNARVSNIRERGKLEAPGLSATEAVKSIKENPKAHLRQTFSLKGAIPEINAAIRGTRLYRPGYLLPNLAGGLTTNVLHGSITELPTVARLARTYPGFLKKVAAQTGGGISHAVAKERGPFSQMSREQPGVIQALTGGVGESFGKITDFVPRANAFVKEAKRQGYKTDHQIVDLLFRGASKTAPPALRKDLDQVLQRAEDASIRFSSSNAPIGTARVSNAIVRNTFLGSWLRASARYGAHVAVHHPVSTAAIAQLGKQSPDISKVLKKYPQFLANAIPVSGGKTPRVLQTGAYSLFDYPFDVASQVKSAKGDLRNLIGPLQPTTHFTGEALTGYDPFTGIELRNPTTRERLLFALANENVFGSYSPFVPQVGPHYGSKKHPTYAVGRETGRYYDSEAKRLKRLFPRTPKDVIMNFLLGGSFYPTPVNPDVAAKMSRPRTKPKKHKKDKIVY